MKLFAKLDDEAQAYLRGTSAWRQLAPGEVLYRHGEPAHGMAVIAGGRLEVLRAVDGGEARIAERGPDEVVGEMALLAPDHARTATVRALEKATIMEIPGDPLDLFRRAGRPDMAVQLGKNLVGLLAAKLRQRDGAPPPPRGDAGVRPQGAWRPGVDLDAIEARLPKRGILRKAVETRVLGPGQVLLREGDASDGFHFVHSGELRVFAKDGAGTRELPRRRGPTIVGETGYFSGAPRMATIEAATEVAYTEFRGSDFDALARKSPEDALVVLYGAAQAVLQLLYPHDDFSGGA